MGFFLGTGTPPSHYTEGGPAPGYTGRTNTTPVTFTSSTHEPSTFISEETIKSEYTEPTARQKSTDITEITDQSHTEEAKTSTYTEKIIIPQYTSETETTFSKETKKPEHTRTTISYTTIPLEPEYTGQTETMFSTYIKPEDADETTTPFTVYRRNKNCNYTLPFTEVDGKVKYTPKSESAVTSAPSYLAPKLSTIPEFITASPPTLYTTTEEVLKYSKHDNETTITKEFIVTTNLPPLGISTTFSDKLIPIYNLTSESDYICNHDSNCTNNTSCISNHCLDPCLIYTPCPENIKCDVVAHEAMCLCPLKQTEWKSIGCEIIPGKQRLQAVMANPWMFEHEQAAAYDKIWLLLAFYDILSKQAKEHISCQSHLDCSSQQACINRKCQNPCAISNPCTQSQDCQVQDHQPVCSIGMTFKLKIAFQFANAKETKTVATTVLGVTAANASVVPELPACPHCPPGVPCDPITGACLKDMATTPETLTETQTVTISQITKATSATTLTFSESETKTTTLEDTLPTTELVTPFTSGPAIQITTPQEQKKMPRAEFTTESTTEGKLIVYPITTTSEKYVTITPQYPTSTTEIEEEITSIYKMPTEEPTVTKIVLPPESMITTNTSTSSPTTQESKTVSYFGSEISKETTTQSVISTPKEYTSGFHTTERKDSSTTATPITTKQTPATQSEELTTSGTNIPLTTERVPETTREIEYLTTERLEKSSSIETVKPTETAKTTEFSSVFTTSGSAAHTTVSDSPGTFKEKFTTISSPTQEFLTTRATPEVTKTTVAVTITEEALQTTETVVPKKRSPHLAHQQPLKNF
ncbi:hypothetical protein NQ317_004228 [Molorchus minor]|uniref:Uncharacterized protein n=1 Tax=Molorchus minor TaxID=1323400 RepID=A0ABQ9JM27_9CUCU|nr:hypothetical protein NQ317_004228 [Molorchus minor]